MPKYIAQFQAIPIGGIDYRTQVRDYNGHEVPAHKFTLEVKHELIPEDAVFQIFDGNPLRVIIQDQKKNFKVSFVTTLGRFSVGIRSVGDDRIQHFSIPFVAYARDVAVIGDLHDLWLEEYLYVEVTRHQLKLGDNLDPGKRDQKLKAKQKKGDNDQGQEGLDLDGKDAE